MAVEVLILSISSRASHFLPRQAEKKCQRKWFEGTNSGSVSKALWSIHKGMPHKFYHGRTVWVWNVTKRAMGVEINMQEFLLRIKLKAEAKARGEIINTKRQSRGPKPGFMLEGATLETATPIPYVVVNDLNGGY
ncbi:60S ribosomal L21-1 [Olea europaea subsp. europaea]|uniref:60S ribosomal L21-1 n=1 Tax=Olea europaea subsp. europaea TaxID=158383 RepID=A0A8S0UT49_OLEEU|nr:60S ribosomal L21-1 [Olea europaea subsp. europaea]